MTGNSVAEVLVFVHGYNSTGATWYKNGIFSTLKKSGWQDAGSLFPQPGLGVYHQGPQNLLKHRMLTVDLPSEAPLQIQADVLQNYFIFLEQQEPGQTYTLIAHSAGGIAARMMLLSYPNPNIRRFITIASPHLGSGMAEVAELVSKSPIGMMAPIVGADEISDADILFEQLQREKPFTLLFRLNRQVHPDIDYISIVRNHGTFFDKDFFVPAYSQDMRNVPGIKHALFIPSHGDHELQYRDGITISKIVNTPAR